MRDTMTDKVCVRYIQMVAMVCKVGNTFQLRVATMVNQSSTIIKLQVSFPPKYALKCEYIQSKYLIIETVEQTFGNGQTLSHPAL